jgi:hypothetical protein
MAQPANLKRTGPDKKKPVDDSLLRDLGRGTMGSLQYVGESLSKPSRALWGSLNYLSGGDAGGGLLNLVPFSDTAGMTDARRGVELSGFLEAQGIQPANQPGFDALDIPRFAEDVIGDPLNAVSGIGLLKSVGRGGSVLAKASGDIGKLSRVGRMTTTVEQAAKGIPKAALETAAKRSGFASGADLLARHGSESVGGLLSLNRPLGGPVKALGTGPLAQKIGGALDKVGEIARYGKIPGTEFSPGQQVARVFSPSAKGLHTPEIDPYGQKLYSEENLIRRGVKSEAAREFVRMYKGGAADETGAILGRMHAENVLDAKRLKPELRRKAEVMAEVLKPFKSHLAEEYNRAQRLGTRLDHFADPAGIDYFPREFVDLVQNAAHHLGREDYLRGIELGTENIRRMIADPKILDGSMQDAVEYFKKEWAPKFVVRENEDVLFRKVVHRIRNVYTPEQRAVGGFGRNPLLDAQDALIGGRINNAKTESVIDAISDNAEGIMQMDRKGDTVPVWDILEQAGIRAGVERPQFNTVSYPPGSMIEGPVETGMTVRPADPVPSGYLEQSPGTALARPTDNLPAVRDGLLPVNQLGEMEGIIDDATTTKTPKQSTNNGALYRIAEALAKKRGIKQAITPEYLQEIGNMEVSAAQAADIIRLAKGDDIKTQVGTLTKLFDSFTNLFKVGVLNWPARYVRDHVSGQVFNMLTGNWSAKSYAQAGKLVGGGIEDFTDIPLVRQMLDEQGLEATAENSTWAMREILYANDIYGGLHGKHGAGDVVGGGVLPGRTADFVGEFAGLDPLSARRPSTLLAGSTINPLKVRGVGGNIRTDNYLAATGERAGKLSDGLNRIVPFIENLRKGVEPDQAKQIVDAIQVNYAPNAFTAAERKYLRRAFPFYAFQSRITKTVLGELADRPGGPLGQTIRAQNETRADDTGPVPEYIAKSMAVPLGETSTGDKTFLTGLDMMHDPALNLVGFEDGAPSLPGTVRNVLSMANPYPKSIAELGFGKTLFQNRDLEDSDPTAGRLISNVSDLAGLGKRELPSGRAKPFINTTVEQALANSPASRLLSTLRVATDKRKYEGGPFPGSLPALNLLTGAKVAQVSPQSQEAVLRDALARMSKREGASSFESTRFSKSQIAEAEKRDPDLAARMRALNAAATELTNRAKQRKAAKSKQAAR